MGDRGSGSSDHNWVEEAADILGWSRLGIRCLLPEEDIAWEEQRHIARCLGCNRSLLPHPFFAPLVEGSGKGKQRY